jgi:hypothetical protein
MLWYINSTSFWSFCKASDSLETFHSSIQIKLKQAWKNIGCEIIWNIVVGMSCHQTQLLSIFTLSHIKVNYSYAKCMDCCGHALCICSGLSTDILNIEYNNIDTLSTLTSCFLMMVTNLIYLKINFYVSYCRPSREQPDVNKIYSIHVQQPQLLKQCASLKYSFWMQFKSPFTILSLLIIWVNFNSWIRILFLL